MVVRGSGRMKVDEASSSSSRHGTRCASRPVSWRGYEAGPEGLGFLVVGAPRLGEGRREDVDGQRDWWAD